jgi:DNA replication licensing factor MCM7
MYITPRTLLGIIRISQALARLHFRDVIEQPDVDQALKLMDYSIRSLRKIKDESRGKRRGGK